MIILIIKYYDYLNKWLFMKILIDPYDTFLYFLFVSSLSIIINY